MRKNLIAMSVAAFVGGLGMAGGAAAAVFLDNGAATISPSNAVREDVRQSGTGHQLILPYFNTQNGNATLANIVNNDLINGKAVKVRFRGGSNSDDVFDFQLYLSPGDHWSMNISRGAAGLSTLSTNDKSCTIPSGTGKDNGGPLSTFVTARLPLTFVSGDALAAETREGYVEVFNMADIPPNLPNADGSVSATANPLFAAIKHQNGVPNCLAATMNTLQFDPASLAGAYALGFRAPTASLFANWTIVNVPKSGSSSGEFAALTAVIPPAGGSINSTPANGNIVFFPQVPGAVPNIDFFTADPSFRTTAGPLFGDVQNGAGAAYAGGTTPIYQAQFFDLPDLSTPYLSNTPPSYQAPLTFVNQLQAALATARVDNEYLTDPSINAFTDWTFSQPTRRYAVVADYRTATIGRAFSFNNFYNAATTSVNNVPGKTYQICAATTGVTYFDREERTDTATQFVVSPNTPQPAFRLCGETSVLTFNSAGASVLGATIAQANVSTTISGVVNRDGWARVGFIGAGGLGLPVLGKAFVSAATGTFNIGASWEHRYLPTAP